MFIHRLTIRSHNSPKILIIFLPLILLYFPTHVPFPNLFQSPIFYFPSLPSFTPHSFFAYIYTCPFFYRSSSMFTILHSVHLVFSVPKLIPISPQHLPLFQPAYSRIAQYGRSLVNFNLIPTRVCSFTEAAQHAKRNKPDPSSFYLTHGRWEFLISIAVTTSCLYNTPFRHAIVASARRRCIITVIDECRPTFAAAFIYRDRKKSAKIPAALYSEYSSWVLQIIFPSPQRGDTALLAGWQYSDNDGIGLVSMIMITGKIKITTTYTIYCTYLIEITSV